MADTLSARFASAVKTTLELFLPPQLEDWYTRRQRGELRIEERKKPETIFVQVVDHPPCKMMVFQGPPFDDKDFEQAIASLWDVMNDYKPETYGFTWADEDGPRFQLNPMGYRGYIEGRPVRPV